MHRVKKILSKELYISFHFKIPYGGGPFSKDAGFQGSHHLKYNTNKDKLKIKNLNTNINKIVIFDI